VSEDYTDRLGSDWVKKELAALRQQLEAAGHWSDAIVALFSSLSSPLPLPVEQNDLDMLSFIVNDALKGVDIATLYPAFHARLLADPQLRQTYEDLLDVLEDTAADPDQADPLPISRELPFLEPTRTNAIVQPTAPGRWQLAWRLLCDHLTQNFFGAPALDYRLGLSLLEDESFILVEEEVLVAEQTLSVMLEAIRPVAEPEQLRLQLFTATPSDPLPSLEAIITWGDYTATAWTDRYGQAYFPPIQLHTILDQSEQRITADLQLILELHSA
jgi:hypothetical protein